ncbi:MAG TPA: hypothetical protein VGJ84_00550 [Polyangiaceae bacterium]
MRDPSPSQSEIRPTRRLPVFGHGRRITRHPNDGWQLADPYPMGPRALRSLRALIVAICPPSPAPSSPELFQRVELGVRHFMRYMSPLAARLLWLTILVLDWAPRLLLVGWKRLHQLRRRDTARIFGRLTHSKWAWVRLLMSSVRGAILAHYFDQEEVHRALNYAPIPFLSERVTLRQRLLKEKHAESA